jgi:hypothetical protein
MTKPVPEVPGPDVHPVSEQGLVHLPSSLVANQGHPPDVMQESMAIHPKDAPVVEPFELLR